ncbi:MAG: putative molybdenum carrier protein [Deltaproteobacteria bacterium]|nr:putative molybdenum carrier protein [Deltaproteobacteria bacterium]
MIRKIISGGQTGADRAALDAAIEMGIDHGGWVPKGRKTEEGPLPDRYRMKEMPTAGYAARTEQNVLDSDGTVILSHGKLTGGSALTRRLAKRHGRPWLHIDLTTTNSFRAAGLIDTWIARNEIATLNVAGPKASEDPDIYGAVAKVLKALFYLHIIHSSAPPPKQHPRDLPQTVAEAVERILSRLTLKDKTSIANMKYYELPTLYPTLGAYIREEFGLSSGNRGLIRSCCFVAKKRSLQEEDATRVILRQLWSKLKETHLLRVLK